MDQVKLSVIERGFRDASEDELRAATVRRGYEKELARLLLRELGEDARSLFVAEMPDMDEAEQAVFCVRTLISAGEAGARFAEYFTELYKRAFGQPKYSDVFARESDEEGDDASSGIALVSGGSIDLAYESFSKKLAFPETIYPIHTQRLNAACDAVAGGEAGYAIIPVKNASDGRLRSFYRMIGVYDLKIAAVCTVGADENAMRYALCTRNYRQFSENPEYFEISLPADGDEALTVASAARSLGYTLYEMSSSPSERDGEIYSFTFAAKRDPIPLILYMNLYHPRYTVLGIYDAVSDR